MDFDINKTHIDDVMISLMLSDRLQPLQRMDRTVLPGINTFEARTFFLNPDRLQEETKTSTMEDAVWQKISRIWPAPEILADHKKFLMATFLAAKAIGIGVHSAYYYLSSRADDRITLAEYIGMTARIPHENLDIPSDVNSCGVANLNVLSDINFATAKFLSPAKDFDQALRWQSHQSAGTEFSARGGDEQTKRLLRDAYLISAFTQMNLPFQAIAFSFEKDSSPTNLDAFYSSIFLDLARRREMEVTESQGRQFVKPLTFDKLPSILASLYDEYSNTMSVADQANFRILHQMAFNPAYLEFAPNHSAAVLQINDSDMLRLKKALVVHSTINALGNLLGPNYARFAPKRGRALQTVRAVELTFKQRLN